MSWPLLRKELRDQRAFAWLGLALVGVELFQAVTRQFDRFPLDRLFHQLGDAEVVFQVLVSFAVGSGLLMRELDEGTLGFLDGLPLTRQRLFFSKLATAAVVLQVYPACRVVLVSLEHLASRESLDLSLHPALLLTALGLSTLATLVGLAAGLLFGFLRSLAWVALAVCAVALNLATERWPRLSALNPVELVSIHLVGDRWRVPAENLVAQVALLVVLLSLAWWRFSTSGNGRSGALQRWLTRPVVSALVGALTIVVGVTAVALYSRTDDQDRKRRQANKAPTTAEFAQAPPGHAQTTHYTFSYPAHRAERVQALLHGADGTFERVGVLLGVDGGGSIDVDLAGSVQNTEGTAYYDRIRMDLGGDDPLATLGHETAHVFAKRLAGGQHERELSQMVVLNEGLARWVERHLAPDGGLTELDRFEAAVVSQRHLVTAPQLTDLEKLAREADQNLKYPLGATLIDALVERYGPLAPRALLLTLGNPDFPRRLNGLELWQAAFQLSGFDLPLVLDDYSRRLKQWEADFAPVLAKLPRPRGSLVRRDDEVGVELRYEGAVPQGYYAVVRFRPAEDSSLREYLTRPVVRNVAWHSLDQVANGEVCFQPGLSAGGVILFESWSCLPLDSAAVLPDEEPDVVVDEWPDAGPDDAAEEAPDEGPDEGPDGGR